MAVPCARCGTPVGPAAARCPRCGEPSAPPEELTGRTLQRWTPAEADASLSDPRAGQVVAGRYRIVRRIGEGGMGSVYAAWQIGVEQEVALKFIHPALVREPEIARRFTNEARSYARLQHPNAVALHDVGQDEAGIPFICMEMFHGEDLATALTRSGRLSVAEVLEIGLQASDVLGHAHSLGIVHRDLKPENILVREGIRGVHVKVVDFGIARLLGDPASTVTRQGPMVGTPGYMAPEQILSRPVDGRADVYALGMVLFHLMAGRHPFGDARTLTEMMAAQVHAQMPTLQEMAPDLRLPPGLDAVIQRATRKDPAERYQSMKELIEALSAVQKAMALAGAGTGDEAAQVDPFEKTSRVELPASGLRTPSGSRRWIAAGVVAASGVVLVGGALMLASAPRPAPAPSPAPVEPVGPVGSTGSVAGRAGSGDAARELQRVLVRQTAVDVLVKSRAELAVGNLDGARQLLEGSREALESVAGDAQIQPQVDSLRAEVAQVAEALSRAQALARRGDCAGAIKLYDEILREHAGIRQARAARDQCRRMLPPKIAE